MVQETLADDQIAFYSDKRNKLPAGSTLLMPNGVHVPHPRTEAYLAGAGDARMGETAAVTEDHRTGKFRPLAEECKPKVITRHV